MLGDSMSTTSKARVTVHHEETIFSANFIHDNAHQRSDREHDEVETIEIIDETDYDEYGYDTVGLIGGQHLEFEDFNNDHNNNYNRERPDAWIRPYWLGAGLFLTLFSFWILDSLKEPIFALLLVDGKIGKHQPPAKLCSVMTTLFLVCTLEVLSNARRKQASNVESKNAPSHDNVLSGGGRWNRMPVGEEPSINREDSVPASLFLYLGVSYCLIFLFVAYALNFHPAFSAKEIPQLSSSAKLLWRIMAYFTFAMIESFGSLTVATFWSYTNSTLNLLDAERYYGLIIACAQIGAIGGSTMVTKGSWPTDTLLLVVSMVILLMVIVMTSYDRRFPSSSYHTSTRSLSPIEPAHTAWTGVKLILQHNYVLLILGVSCLYEVALTCLDYQMKLLGFDRFEGSSGISFAQFLGRFGQLTNILSLFISSLIFPLVIRKIGLRRTLLIFPTLLVIATIVAYTAIPGNLTVLFVCMSLLKAMTYSMHDPAKELLYMPTSNSIKFRSKFWIDVVGERVAKAIGSSINTMAGSVARSLTVATWPSILSALGLWYVCYLVGKEFESLLITGKIVGLDTMSKSDSNGFYRPISGVDDDERLASMLFKAKGLEHS